MNHALFTGLLSKCIREDAAGTGYAATVGGIGWKLPVTTLGAPAGNVGACSHI